MRHITRIFQGLLAAVLVAFPAAGQPADAGLARSMALIEAALPAGEAEAFGATLQELGPEAAPMLGHLLYTRRHFDKAAWFFGAGAGPEDAAALANLGAVLNDLNANRPETYPMEVLELSGALLERAVVIDTEAAAAWNDLARAATRLAAARGGDPDLAARAADAGRNAVELDPGDPLYWSNLAEALALVGDAEGASKALAEAHQLSPVYPAFLGARARMADMGVSAPVTRPYCTVDYRCQELCPRSIIGGLMSVTCEMENASAQMACEAGEPYAPSYNCAEEFPEYGILIPGLNAGFSVSVPGFSAHVIVDGDGTVRVRVEGGPSVGPVGGYLRADGEFSPNGDVSVTNIGGGVRVSVLNSNAAGGQATAFGHSPLQIEAETVGGDPVVVGVEAYNAAIISN